jgi:hypothetical protein
VSTLLFSQMVEFFTSFWLVILDVSIPYSDVCSLKHNDNASPQKSITFVTMVTPYALADCQMVALVLSCKLFWNISCTKFMKSK